MDIEDIKRLHQMVTDSLYESASMLMQVTDQAEVRLLAEDMRAAAFALENGRDIKLPSVQVNKAEKETLLGLIQMWRAFAINQINNN